MQDPTPQAVTTPHLNKITAFLGYLAKMTPEERDEWERRVGYFVEEIEFRGAPK